MSKDYDIFDNLNSYLEKSDNFDIPEDELEGSYSESDPPPVVSPAKGRKISRKKPLVGVEDQEPVPTKKKSPLKKKPDTETDDDEYQPSTASGPTIEPPTVTETIELDDDLDQQMKEMEKQYNLIFGQNSSCTKEDRKYFNSLKKRYESLVKQSSKPVRRSSRGRGPSIFSQNLQSLSEIFYNICVNYNLMTPVAVSSVPSTVPSTTGTTRRRARRQEPELINLVDSPALILPGCVNLDSDEEIENTAPKKTDLSFDSDNYEMSLKIWWQGSIERFTHRKFQKFSELIDQLAARAGTSPSSVVLDLNDQIIDPNDTPDSIGYRITQFINGRVVEANLADAFAKKLKSSSNSGKAATTNKNVIKIKIQSDRFKHPLEISIGREQKMKIAFIKCAEELKCSPDQIRLSFDGDLVDIDATVTDLELEGGEILDLRF